MTPRYCPILNPKTAISVNLTLVKEGLTRNVVWLIAKGVKPIDEDMTVDLNYRFSRFPWLET